MTEIEVTINAEKDTRDNLLKRFESNIKALYTLCVAAMKDMSNGSSENVIINVLQNKYQEIIRNTTGRDRLVSFSVHSAHYVEKILKKDEEFFGNLGGLILDEHADNITSVLGGMVGGNIINTLKDMMSRIVNIDQKAKDKIWTILTNMLKICKKYEMVS